MPDNAMSYDYVIVGAGPAGLQLAYFLDRAGRDYVVLERAERAGSFFEHYPRHRKLLSINKVYTGREDPEFNLRHDWNSLLTNSDEPFLFKDYSTEYFPDADALVRYLNDFADRFELRVRYGFEVARVARDGALFSVSSADGTSVQGRRLIMATGIAKPFIPDIPGIEHAEGYEDISVDPENFAGQNVLILGKGNSAFETANSLMAHAAVIHISSPNPFRFAWDSHFVGHLRSVNTIFIDSYLLKSQNGIYDGETLSIERLDSGKLRVRWLARHTDIEQEIEQFEYDRIIRCTGFRADVDVFDEACRPALRDCGRLPSLTGAWESTSVPGLYFAGTLMQTLDYHKSQSSFIHGFRFNVRTLFHILETRYEGVGLPYESIEITPDNLARSLLERADRSCALWQQVGFLTDVIELSDDGDHTRGRWYKDLSGPYVEHTWGARPDCEYYTMMLAYWPFSAGENAFQHVHHRHAAAPHIHGDIAIEIHPVIRHYKGSELLAEYHVRSDPLTDWDSNLFRDPLVEFFRCDLAGETPPAIVRPKRRELIRDANMRFSDVIVDGRSVH